MGLPANMNRFLLVLLIGAVLASGAAPAASGNPRVDPAVRLLLSRPDAETAGLLRAAAGGDAAPPVPRGLLGALSTTATDARAEIFVDTEDPAAVFAGTGADPIALGSGLYAARVPLAGLRSLVAQLGPGSVRLARPVRFALDRSGSYLKLGALRRFDAQTGSFSGATGRSVLVGIVDGGIDWSHPDFRTADDRTRFVWYWDQTQPFGVSPPGYPFGQEYSAALLNDSRRPGYDPSSHGTHVAAIAAGNGLASRTETGGVRYAGVAPGATLIGVRSNLTEYGVAVGTQYVMAKASALGLPVVVNLSLGHSFGPHRGDTPLERALEDMIGPGRIIVAAAGNDGDDDFHAELELAEGETAIVRLDYPAFPPDGSFSFVDTEGWFDPVNRYRFTVRGPEGEEYAAFEWGNVGREIAGRRGIVRGWNTQDGDWGTALFEIEDNPASPRRPSGVWTVEIEALSVTGDPQLDFWIVNWRTDEDDDAPRLLDHLDPRETILIPATSPHILAVGAMSTRACWTQSSGEPLCYDVLPETGDIAPFSSIGPTSDGRPKPEVYAPGYGVVSARSSTLTDAYWTPEQLAALGTPDGYYLMLQGTSMAAPQVTGTVALLLERFPDLTYEDLAARLKARSREGLDPRVGDPAWFLDTENMVAPVAEVSLAVAEPENDGIRLTWYTGKARGAGRYRVYKGFSDEGPFYMLSEQSVVGGAVFDTFDPTPEVGRDQVYRIAVRDEAGLEEDLDTLRVSLDGVPRFVFRAPDPNPARGAVNLRFFLPPSPAGGRFLIEAFDIAGRRLAEVASGAFSPNGEERAVTWDLVGSDRGRVAGGIYFLRATCRFTPAADGGGEGVPGSRTLIRRVVVLP